jgi:hypothetical protein
LGCGTGCADATASVDTAAINRPEAVVFLLRVPLCRSRFEVWHERRRRQDWRRGCEGFEGSGDVVEVAEEVLAEAGGLGFLLWCHGVSCGSPGGTGMVKKARSQG